MYFDLYIVSFIILRPTFDLLWITTALNEHRVVHLDACVNGM